MNVEVFPCYFGSALKLKGVEELLAGFQRYGMAKGKRKTEKDSPFGAKVFKISRDSQGNRLTHLKVTSGVLKVKDAWGEEEKVNQIRIYSGAKFESVKEAPAGCICAVTGPIHTHPGQGIGSEPASELPMLEPVLTYRILLPFDSDVHKCLQQFKQLEEEEPELHVLWNEELGEIQVQLMGDVQIEILKHMLEERYGLLVGFDTGNIVYKETILNTVEGVGHFEPLRHYAEVHLLLEPGEAGSGLQFDTVCSGGCIGTELAEADPDPSGREDPQRCAYRSGDHRYEGDFADRACPYEAYRGRRFPSGYLPGAAPGTDAGGKPAAGTVLWIYAGTSL